MSKRHPPLGWHTSGSGGNPTGIKEYIKILNEAGIPAVVKCVDGTVGLHEALQYGKEYGVKNHIVFRAELGKPYDIPNYRVSPEEAAIEHWNMHQKRFPPEFEHVRTEIWQETMNELQDIISIPRVPEDKLHKYNMKYRKVIGTTENGSDYLVDQSEWLAAFAYKIATLAVEANVRWLAFGFSGGVPKKKFWKTKEALKLLRYMAEHKDLLGIATHEYSFKETLKHKRHIGRFYDIHEACDSANIEYPNISVTEFGWRYDWVPSTEQFLNDFEANAAQMYTENENILGLMTWYLGSGFQDIANIAQPTVIPSAHWVKEHTYKIKEPTDNNDNPPAPSPSPLPPTNKRKVVTMWIPPYQKLNDKQLTHILDVAENGLKGMTRGGHTLSPAHEDSTTIIKYEGNEDSILIVMYPDIISNDPDFPWETWFSDTYTNLPCRIVFATSRSEFSLFPTESEPVVDTPTPSVEYNDTILDLPTGSFVIDVSAHNNIYERDIPKVKGIMIRTSNGIGKVASVDENGRDTKLYDWLDFATQKELPFGLYHFIANTCGVKEQIELFDTIIQEVSQLYGFPELGIWLDFENTPWNNGAYENEKQIKQCLVELEKCGYSPNVIGVYTRASWWNHYVKNDPQWFRRYMVWVAHYMNRPEDCKPFWSFSVPKGWQSKDVKLWQFTSRGGHLVNWPTQGLDLNYWYNDNPQSNNPPSNNPMTPPSQYTGVPVTFVPMIDQPASDWRWSRVKEVFDKTKLTPKFHTSGNSHKWYPIYKHDKFNIVRVIVKEDHISKFLSAAQREINKYWGLGQRDYIFLNEPNVQNEGYKKLWHNGIDFGKEYRKITQKLVAMFPGIRIWSAPPSPWWDWSPGEVYNAKKWMKETVSVGAYDFCYGMVCHAYSAKLKPEQAAGEIVNEVKKFQQKYSSNKPLIVGEFSLVRPTNDNAKLKALTYHLVYNALANVPGIQAAASFTADWYPNQDNNHEGWYENGIHNEF